MSQVRILTIDAVEQHPTREHLNVNRLGLGVLSVPMTCCSDKEDGQPRWKVGDIVAFIPENAIVPEWLLKQMGYWNDAENKGYLAGKKGDRLKGRTIDDIKSEGIMYRCPREPEGEWYAGLSRPGSIWLGIDSEAAISSGIVTTEETYGSPVVSVEVQIGQDVTNLLGITFYQPQG